MSLQKRHHNSQQANDLYYEKDNVTHHPADDTEHQKKVRRLLEERLEEKRLKEELADELDADFDWDEMER